MSNRKDLTARALIEAAVIKLLDAQHEKTRAELRTKFEQPGEREIGTAFDHRLGSASLKAGASSYRVVDAAAFLEWVSANYAPHAIVRTVDPMVQAAVLSECKKSGGVVLDVATGEVGLPPGVAHRESSPTMEIRADAHATFVAEHWLRRGGDLLELEEQ